MRSFLSLTLLFLTPARADDLTRAREILARSAGVDSHIDTIQRVLIENVDLSRRSSTGHVDIPRLREGGMRAPFFALWVPTYYHGAEAVRRTLQLRDAMQRVLDAQRSQMELALTASDVERITGAGKIAAVLTIESGHAIDDDLAVLRTYYRLGIRSMTLTHFRNTNWADSSTDKPAHNGLTEFGKQVVREMNRLGMIVDISHVADKTFYDTLQVTTQPVIASHSSCRAISDVPRNMTDDMVRALAKNGGVIGINFGEGFLNQKDAEMLKQSINTISYREPNLTGKELDAYAAKNYQQQIGKAQKAFATVDDVVAHIDRVVKIAGIDHVGIGSDYDGIAAPPQGLEDVSKMPAVVAALLKRGYKEEDILKILGGNFLRVMRRVTESQPQTRAR
jgi:membrane dipeptidase